MAEDEMRITPGSGPSIPSVILLLAWALPLSAADVDRRVADAMKRQDAQTVQALVAAAADVNAPQPDGATALHWAAYWDDVPSAQLLIRAKARVNVANENNVTPISLACTNGSAAMVSALVAAGADPNIAQTTGETPLMTCARTGNVDAVNTLLSRGASINAKESLHQQTALMWAVSEQHREVARALVAHGADIHARSSVRGAGRPKSGVSVAQTPVEIGTGGSGGFTALLFAARVGDVDLARMLLENGADVNETAADGSTPLIVAALRGHVAVAKFLLDRGADPNAHGPGYTALHWTAGSWETQLTGPFGIESQRDEEWDAMRGLKGPAKLELLNALLAHGADPNVRLAKEPPRFGYANLRFHVGLAGATPFLLAARVADVEIMRQLAAHGADTSLATNLHTTPLMVAAGIGRVPNESFVTESSTLEAVKLALELGGNVNVADDIGDTALHGAAHIRSAALVRFLADCGAKVNVTNKRGLTPLMIADGAGNSDNPGLGSGGAAGELLRQLSGRP
jgi:ankyrin repeat protein